MIDAHEPQGEFVESGIGDKWVERGNNGRWVRKHRTPRSALFTPMGVPHGPGRKTRLKARRETIGVDEAGNPFHIIDSWQNRSVAHRLMPSRWTGVTVFSVAEHDDGRYGGDQRRQREEAGVRGVPGGHRVAWADVTDDDD